MKVLICIKRVIDYNVKIHVSSDHSSVVTAGVRYSMNPFDEIAVTAAVQLKEAGHAKELIAVSIGTNASNETLRTALAMGVDRATLIETAETFEPVNIAKILKHQVLAERPDLVLLGKQAIDDDANQTGQMLAALLGWPQATFASKIECLEKTLHVTREVDGGLEVLELSPPAVITADLRLATPRPISLPNIMKAKQKPLNTIALDSLLLNLPRHTKLISVKPPIPRQGGRVVASVQELVTKLHDEAKVI